MGDKANIGLVDPHPKGDRGDNHDAFFPDESVPGGAGVPIPDRRDREERPPARPKPEAVSSTARRVEAVDDSCVRRVLGRQEIPKAGRAGRVFGRLGKTEFGRS